VVQRQTPPAQPPEATAPTAQQQPPPLPEWARKLTWLLDDVVQTPGGRFGVGADGIIGLLLPGAGDALTGVGSAALLVLALREGVPTVMIGKMLLNIAIDLVVGLIPVAGDAFDIAFRANRRNYAIIEKYRDPSAEPGATDYLLVIGGFVLSLLILLTPVFMWLFYASAIAFVLNALFGGG
jgi:hypothetical protein